MNDEIQNLPHEAEDDTQLPGPAEGAGARQVSSQRQCNGCDLIFDESRAVTLRGGLVGALCPECNETTDEYVPPPSPDLVAAARELLAADAYSNAGGNGADSRWDQALAWVATALQNTPQPVIDRFLPAGDGVIDCETGHHVSDYDSETLMDFLNTLASSPSQPEGVVIEGESIEATSATSDTLDLRIDGGEIVVPKPDGFSPVELPPGPVTVTVTPKEQQA